MAETKHTPGPWEADGQNIVTCHEADIGIAKVFSNLGQPMKANAELIAAAPELLEHLKLAEKYLAKIVAEGLFESCALHPRIALGRVSNTIAKATGK